jgi:hypothetical protein
VLTSGVGRSEREQDNKRGIAADLAGFVILSDVRLVTQSACKATWLAGATQSLLDSISAMPDVEDCIIYELGTSSARDAH